MNKSNKGSSEFLLSYSVYRKGIFQNYEEILFFLRVRKRVKKERGKVCASCDVNIVVKIKRKWVFYPLN
jgi:hypothetical protein